MKQILKLTIALTFLLAPVTALAQQDNSWFKSKNEGVKHFWSSEGKGHSRVFLMESPKEKKYSLQFLGDKGEDILVVIYMFKKEGKEYIQNGVGAFAVTNGTKQPVDIAVQLIPVMQAAIIKDGKQIATLDLKSIDMPKLEEVGSLKELLKRRPKFPPGLEKCYEKILAQHPGLK